MTELQVDESPRAPGLPSAAALAVPVLTPSALPSVVLLPSPTPVGSKGAEAQLRQIGPLLIVPLYSSPEALVACCGPDQPWFAVASDDIDAMVQEWCADLVLLDTAFQGTS